MACVIDASVTAGFFLPDESGDALDAVAEAIQRDGAVAPVLWQVKVLNLLLMAVRRKRITPTEQKQLAEAIDALPATVQPILTQKQRTEVLHLAETHMLTGYDAVYLELAMRTGSALATLDKALRKAAKAGR
jgi:predicted nucleic acid-binding protein